VFDALGQVQALDLRAAGLVEPAQLDACGVSREQRKVSATSVCSRHWHVTCLSSGRPMTQQFSRVLARNIDGLLAMRREEERQRSSQDRISDAITRFTGSLRFVYIHAVVFGGWIIWNLGWIPGVPVFDPSFVALAMIASVEAIFLSTFVLISQNRMQALADRRAELDLQISLLAEHEVTQVMTLLDAVAEHLGVARSADPAIQEVKQDVDPRAVLDAIDRKANHLGET
jgi:uncharacterized membrane protein